LATLAELVKEKQAWTGKPVKRKEDARLLTGFGRFVDDVKLPGMAYAAILRSPYAHARILRIDVSKAEKIPGVICTLTGEEVAKLTDPFLQISPPPANKIKDYCLAVGKVRYFGEPVVAVVAESRAIAEDALEHIEVEYEVLEHVLDAREALKPNAPVIHEEAGTNLVFRGVWDYGNVREAKREADRVIKKKLHFHRFSSTPIEPNAVIAHHDKATGMLTVYSNNQMPMFCIPWVASALRFPSNKIRMITGDIGGGFGTKIINYPYIVLVSLLAMKSGRPVKWVEDRTEHLIAGTHGNERTFEVEIAARKDGTILGLDVKAWDDCGAYTRYEPAGAVIWAQVTPGCYRFKNFRMEFYQVVTNKSPVGPNRGYSRLQHLWMIERCVDFVARELKLDPTEVRLKNFIRAEEMPYTTPSGSVYDGGNYTAALKKALNVLGYSRWRRIQKEMRAKGRLIGIGVSISLDSAVNNFGQVRILNPDNPFSGNSEGARILLDVFGQIQVALGTSPQGQGHETIAAQVVADQFGITPDQVNVLMGFDSTVNPFSHQSGAYASRSAVMLTGALLSASNKLKEKIAKIASHMMKCSQEDIEFMEGNVVDLKSGKKIPLWQIANVAWVNNVLLPPGMEPGLVAISHWRPEFKQGLPDEKWRVEQTLTYSYQCHAAVIELDKETGKFRILKYVIVDDCGRQINPMIVEGQVHGAAAHGIGAAMFENFEYSDDGILKSSTFVDYLVPTALDIPDIRTERMETPSLFAPLGLKGVGEGGGTPLATIAQAVEDALLPYGIEITDSHQNPYRIYEMIKLAGKKQSRKKHR
jgi:carbon-monoxide dehydrogenase large subunit